SASESPAHHGGFSYRSGLRLPILPPRDPAATANTREDRPAREPTHAHRFHRFFEDAVCVSAGDDPVVDDALLIQQIVNHRWRVIPTNRRKDVPQHARDTGEVRLKASGDRDRLREDSGFI